LSDSFSFLIHFCQDSITAQFLKLTDTKNFIAMNNSFRTKILVVLFALAGGFAGAYILQKVNPEKMQVVSTGNVPVRMVSYNPAAPENAIDFTTAAEMSIHAVVHVKTVVRQEVPLFNDPWGFWGKQYNQERIQQGSGSGVIITDNGYIVTNNHVVEGAEQVEVTLNDLRTFKAKVIAADPSTDIALLKIDQKNLPYIMYGNSDDLKLVNGCLLSVIRSTLLQR
jgi:S1-C subfamily serine protease